MTWKPSRRLVRSSSPETRGAAAGRAPGAPGTRGRGRCPRDAPSSRPRHVDDRQLAAVVDVDGAEHRLDGGERVVRDLRRGVRDAAQQAGLADVGEAEQRSVGHQLQLELECPHLAVDPDSATRGAWRVAVAKRRLPRPRPAAGDHDPRRRVREVGDQRAVGRSAPACRRARTTRASAPRPPVRLEPSPWLPLPALTCGL